MITTSITIRPASHNQRGEIIKRLQEEKLPVDDLPLSLDHFFVATENDEIIGAIGLERYDDCGLLRSMVVSAAHRSKGIASQLVEQLETYANSIGIQRMYLLTETAEHYFAKKGYERISREQVPESLQASSEFSHVCPVSAVMMEKQL